MMGVIQASERSLYSSVSTYPPFPSYALVSNTVTTSSHQGTSSAGDSQQMVSPLACPCDSRCPFHLPTSCRNWEQAE